MTARRYIKKPDAKTSLGIGLQLYSALQKNRYLIVKILRQFSFGPAEIEDVTQETMLRALEAAQKQNIRHPRQFLISIAKNVAREEMRKRARTTSQTIEDCALENHIIEEPTAESALDAREKLSLFATAVAGLPPQCRRVFVMKHVYGYAHKEIAGKLGISVSTVEKHVAHGLKICRKEMLSSLNKSKNTEEVVYLFNEARKLEKS